MALTQALQEARRQTATRDHRARQTRAELRLEEQIAVSTTGDLIDGFRRVDSINDARFYRACRNHMATLTTDEQRDSFAKVYAAWMRDEVLEERSIDATDANNDEALLLLRQNTPTFVEGSYVPSGSGDVA